jgi:hypothetical protein
MKRICVRKLARGTAALTLLLGLSGGAEALVCDVSPVAGASKCQVGSQNDDTIDSSPLQVNADEIFKHDDWIFAGRVIEDEKGKVDIGLSATSISTDERWLAGTWAIDKTSYRRYDSIMLVFTGPKNFDYIAFLLDGMTTRGKWETPFVDLEVKYNKDGTAKSSKTKLKAVGHISAYVRISESVPVPEPTTLVLAGIGLAGIGLGRRKRAGPG